MIYLRPGDVFCVNSHDWVSRAIIKVTGFWDVDGTSDYSHAGIITDKRGSTFEALWTIKESHLVNYIGSDIIIGRWSPMTTEVFYDSFSPLVPQFLGESYPLWRLPLFVIPPLARKVSTGKYLVCSELTAKFLKNAGAISFFTGVSPDYIADMIRRWANWEVVYEGILDQLSIGWEM
jgi:hypothetical protein